jgi:hypothetical protein
MQGRTGYATAKKPKSHCKCGVEERAQQAVERRYSSRRQVHSPEVLVEQMLLTDTSWTALQNQPLTFPRVKRRRKSRLPITSNSRSIALARRDDGGRTGHHPNASPGWALAHYLSLPVDSSESC